MINRLETKQVKIIIDFYKQVLKFKELQEEQSVQLKMDKKILYACQLMAADFKNFTPDQKAILINCGYREIYEELLFFIDKIQQIDNTSRYKKDSFGKYRSNIIIHHN